MKDVSTILDRSFARLLKRAILFSVLGEAVILLLWGFPLFPDGSWFNEFMWTMAIVASAWAGP